MPRAKTHDARADLLQDVAKDVRGSFHTVEGMTESFIRQAILRGVFRPGERVPQDEIAAVLGVSRMPVRASLRPLEAEGLLDIRPHRGAIVASLRREEITELYEMRVLLERYLLGRAIANLTDGDLARLEGIAQRLEGTEGLAERLDARKTFYRELYAVAGRPRAAALVEQLRDSVGRYLLLQRVDEGATGHFALLDFVRKRDQIGAAAWLETHLQRVSSELQRLVPHAGPEDESAGVDQLRTSG
jgi:DNA-binding GntR family transcriptional regulator